MGEMGVEAAIPLTGIRQGRSVKIYEPSMPYGNLISFCRHTARSIHISYGK
jgi:hypothetical protein